MSDAPKDPPENDDTGKDATMAHDHDDRPETTEPPKENLIHFNPWRDFNDAAPMADVFGDEPDPEQIAQFMEVVFGYCDGLIPVRSFIDKGQGIDGWGDCAESLKAAFGGTTVHWTVISSASLPVVLHYSTADPLA